IKQVPSGENCSGKASLSGVPAGRRRDDALSLPERVRAMASFTRRHFGALSTAGALGLVLTACGTSSADTDAAAGEECAAAATVEVEDNHGTETVEGPPESAVATDNRTIEVLADWGVTHTAAASALMPSTNPLKDDESIIDLGNHREPDLEAVRSEERRVGKECREPCSARLDKQDRTRNNDHKDQHQKYTRQS